MKPMGAIFFAILLTLLFSAAAKVKSQGAAKQLFLDNKCNRCHSLLALGIEKAAKHASSDEEEEEADKSSSRKAPDLSDEGTRHDAAWIAKWLNKQEEIKGKKHKKRFRGSAEDREALGKWLSGMKNPHHEPPK